ncbi:MAG: CoA-binding protein [Deltaproteobacteria bacterium]|nr:CoA-binding protein [Candidatus Zymogenaceae bacterium]
MTDYEILDRIIHPKSIAVVGASPTPGKYGWLYLLAIQSMGYAGNIYPINKKVEEIRGVKTYPSLEDLPEAPDLAVFTIPARHVPEELERARRLGVKGAVIQSAGFSEDGDEGARLEEEIKKISKKGIRVIGPNCFGTYSPKTGITVIPGSDFSREPGPVGFFAQSGGMTADLGQLARSYGVRFSAMVSYGNGADVTDLDLLSYFARDPDTHIIAAYLEGVSDGEKFFRLLKETAPKKPVVIWKGGTTPAGRRAVMSHTGSLGGEERVWDGIFAQTGAVRVTDLSEMIDTLMAFSLVYPKGGRRLAMLGGGGALCVEASDIAYHYQFTFPSFSQDVSARIGSHLSATGSSPGNPVDTGNPMVPPDALLDIMEAAANTGDIDTILLSQTMQHIHVIMRRITESEDTPLSSFAYYPRLAEGIKKLRLETDVPIVGVFPRTSTTEDDQDMELEREWRRARSAFLSAGAPVYSTVVRAIAALDRVCRYVEFKNAVSAT